MDRTKFYNMMQGEGDLDYERYLNTADLLRCQSDYEELCNHDELQFQIVHQVEELWMKLIAYTLLDIDERILKRETNRVITLFRRVHRLQQLMIDQLNLLETMSPKEYQEIRLKLGNGSGQESPGFRTLLTMPKLLWDSFETVYLKSAELTVSMIYNDSYQHCDAYVVAEALAEFDELFQNFRFHHVQVIQRTIGLESKSLKGRPVEMLERSVRARFYPKLWEVRSGMTDAWGSSYGKVRDSLGQV